MWMREHLARMRDGGRDQRGAALVTVLLFMVLTFILIGAMLSTTGNEIVIASLQRDGVRALEIAQLGINEVIQRIEEAHPFMPGFFSASQSAYCLTWPGPGACPLTAITVTLKFTGDDAAYLQIEAQATVGRASRSLITLVLQQMRASPPDVTFANSFNQDGAAAISGDIYSRHFIDFKTYPGGSSYSYAGWRISKDPPGAVADCYNYAHCQSLSGDANVDRWFPGIRRSVYRKSVGPDSAQEILLWAGDAIAAGCDATTGNTIVNGIRAENTTQSNENFWQYGFDLDNRNATGGVISSQLDPDRFPCGLPYKYVQETFNDEAGNPVTRYFKTVVYEDWFENYWRFDDRNLVMVKRGNGSGTQACVDDICTAGGFQPDLVDYPNLGTVPPPPEPVRVEEGNYHLKIEAGVNAFDSDGDGYYEIVAATGYMGCKNPEMAGCAVSDPRVVYITGPPGTKWDLEGNLQGHGTMVIDGDVRAQGTFDYWGTLLINGSFDVSGAGTTRIYGGLVTQGPLNITGNFTGSGGSIITSPPVGRATVVGKAWWER
jgi:Tfp pilus assembly protein PilX/cytoskeletal protein CcmA (bactofilin family)